MFDVVEFCIEWNGMCKIYVDICIDLFCKCVVFFYKGLDFFKFLCRCKFVCKCIIVCFGKFDYCILWEIFIVNVKIVVLFVLYSFCVEIYGCECKFGKLIVNVVLCIDIVDCFICIYSDIEYVVIV